MYDVCPMPAESLTFSLYMLSKIQQGQSYAVCKSTFYGVKHMHKLYLQPDPTGSVLAINLLEAAKRLDTRTKNRKDPITIDILEKLYQDLVVSRNTLTSLRLMCLCILGFSGFLRFDEVSHLRRGDFKFHPTYMTIFIEKSKTDTYRDGKSVYISKGDTFLCPVKITKRYLTRAELQIEEEEHPELDEKFLFRGISKTKRSEKLRKANKPISYTRVREILLKELQTVGLDPLRFGTHSLRAGGATEAANAGVPDRLFKRHGRWVSESAKDGYIQDNCERLLVVTKSMGL